MREYDLDPAKLVFAPARAVDVAQTNHNPLNPIGCARQFKLQSPSS